MSTNLERESASEAFYDAASQKALVDYAHQNPRLTAAIHHALRWIPSDTGRVLDVGCGIGWSTWEIARNRPRAFALGIDLSEKRIEIAQRLFDRPNLTFAIQNVARWDEFPAPPFDAVVMLDVYEHIPEELRDELHGALNKLLSKHGVAILTCPSLFHQGYLRAHRPEALQPVDEDVTLEGILKLSRSIDGQLIQYNHVTIWQPNDYIHMVVQRNPDSIQNSKRTNRNSGFLAPEPEHERINRVSSRLKLSVTGGKFVLPDGQGPVVCIISPNKNAYSETFIRDHIKRLPARVRVLYGGYFPRYRDDGTALLPHPNSVQRLLRAIWRRVLRLPDDYFKQAALKHFLQANGVDAVLAEYGPVGVAVMDACKEASVPLIVYFRGYDVYSLRILEGAGQRYAELFENAAAIFSVSRAMERHLQLDLGAPRQKLYLNPSGVDTTLFHGADPAHAPPIFVAVGRFVDKKAPHLTLLAFKKVVECVPEARLIMIGDGPLWEACKQMAQACGISGAVDFLGPRPHTEVAAVMRGARTFVQHSITPSRGDAEGSPTAIKEAGAAGLPVVSTRHGGIPDIVIERETGFLVDEGDYNGMAEHMTRLARDPDLAARLGRAAREYVCAEFSMERSIDTLTRVIETVIRDHRAEPHPLGRSVGIGNVKSWFGR